jgi:hypothetical protein
MLVVADNEPKLVRDGTGFKTIPANISTFKVGADGKLTFVSNIEVETGDQYQFWSGMVTVS